MYQYYLKFNHRPKPTIGHKTDRHGFKRLNVFLCAKDITLFKEVFQRHCNDRPNRKTRYIKDILKNMRMSDTVCMTMDKTNSTGIFFVYNYQRWLTDPFLKGADIYLHQKVIGLFDEATIWYREWILTCKVKKNNLWDNCSQCKLTPLQIW